MSRTLDIVRAQQAVRQTQAVAYEDAISQAARDQVLKAAYVRANRLLAWCSAHPQYIGRRADLVVAIKDAMARREFVADLIIDLCCEIPEAIEVMA